jgi:hypothetical protein
VRPSNAISVLCLRCFDLSCGVCWMEAHRKESPAEAGLEPCGFDGRISCRPSGNYRMGRRLDGPLGLRRALLGRPSSDRRNSRWHGIHRTVRDGSQRRIRQRLERQNCPEFDYSPTAWPVSPPLTIRQQQQLELKRKTYSFVLSLSERLLHPRAMLSAYLNGHNRSRERYGKNHVNVV